MSRKIGKRPAMGKMKPNKRAFDDEESIASESEEEQQAEDDVTKVAEPRKRKKMFMMEIESGDEGEQEGESSEDDPDETPQEKRIRLAKKFLDQVVTQERERLDEGEEIDNKSIGARLKDDVLERVGRLIRPVADHISAIQTDKIRTLKNGVRLAITCVVVSRDGKFAFSGSKDGILIKWDLKSMSRVKTIDQGKQPYHMQFDFKNVEIKRSFYCLALSSDSKFLASCGHDPHIQIWNPNDLSILHVFEKAHRKPVYGLAFRRNSHDLYSCSADHIVRVWNCNDMVLVDNCFGHTEPVTAIDSLNKERAITVGSRDNTVRLWKIPEQSCLVFQAPLQTQGSMDCVKFLDEHHYITASDQGCISLWHTMKKKPVSTLKEAHGVDESGNPNWIVSLATVPNSDLIASGSNDSQIRIWKVRGNYKGFELKFQVKVPGFINSMQFTEDASMLVAGVGQEHKFGRWWRIKHAKNSVVVIPLAKPDNI